MSNTFVFNLILTFTCWYLGIFFRSILLYINRGQSSSFLACVSPILVPGLDSRLPHPKYVSLSLYFLFTGPTAWYNNGTGIWTTFFLSTDLSMTPPVTAVYKDIHSGQTFTNQTHVCRYTGPELTPNCTDINNDWLTQHSPVRNAVTMATNSTDTYVTFTGPRYRVIKRDVGLLKEGNLNVPTFP